MAISSWENQTGKQPDSKTREQKVDQIYTCREIKNTERYKTASRLNEGNQFILK